MPSLQVHFFFLLPAGFSEMRTQRAEVFTYLMSKGSALEVLVNERSHLFTRLQQVNKCSSRSQGLLARDADSAVPGAESKGNEFLACLGSRGQPSGTGMCSVLLLCTHCCSRTFAAFFMLPFNVLEQTALTRSALHCF